MVLSVYSRSLKRTTTDVEKERKFQRSQQQRVSYVVLTTRVNTVHFLASECSGCDSLVQNDHYLPVILQTAPFIQAISRAIGRLANCAHSSVILIYH